MKVLFLGDCVLNTTPQTDLVFDQDFIQNLQHIVDETDAKIVISSPTLRKKGLDNIKEIWKDKNLPGEVIDVTSNLQKVFSTPTQPLRGSEIEHWIDNESIYFAYSFGILESFVILDDDMDILDEQKSLFCSM